MQSAAVGIAALIGAAIGLPGIGYLLSPGLRGGRTDDGEVALGKVQDFPVGIPTRAEFTCTKVNGWERRANML